MSSSPSIVDITDDNKSTLTNDSTSENKKVDLNTAKLLIQFTIRQLSLEGKENFYTAVVVNEYKYRPSIADVLKSEHALSILNCKEVTKIEFFYL